MVIERFLDLTRLESSSLKEGKVRDYIKSVLEKLDIEFYEDKAGEKIGGESGNIIATLRGNREETVLFSAHMDTVNPCTKVEPIIEDGIIKSKGDTILGGDDKAAIAILLEVLKYAKTLNKNHKSIVCVFSVAEEIGILGAKNLDFKDLGKIDYGYVLDGEGKPGTVYNKAPYSAKGRIEILGKAAHSGINPEEGVNALVVLSKVLNNLKIGRIDLETTCNIGLVEGGIATNVVMPKVSIMFEARSLNLEKLLKLLKEVEEVFKKKCIEANASYTFDVKRGTPGFYIKEESKVIEEFKKACYSLNIKEEIKPCLGGSDTNIFNREGLESVILGIGMEKVHTTEEYIREKDILDMEKIILKLI